MSLELHEVLLLSIVLWIALLQAVQSLLELVSVDIVSKREFLDVLLVDERRLSYLIRLIALQGLLDSWPMRILLHLVCVMRLDGLVQLFLSHVWVILQQLHGQVLYPLLFVMPKLLLILLLLDIHARHVSSLTHLLDKLLLESHQLVDAAICFHVYAKFLSDSGGSVIVFLLSHGASQLLLPESLQAHTQLMLTQLLDGQLPLVQQLLRVLLLLEVVELVKLPELLLVNAVWQLGLLLLLSPNLRHLRLLLLLLLNGQVTLVLQLLLQILLSQGLHLLHLM